MDDGLSDLTQLHQESPLGPSLTGDPVGRPRFLCSAEKSGADRSTIISGRKRRP